MFSLETWYAIIVVGSTVGQTLFVLLYLTFPWYQTFLGKALFIKGVTLMVMLDIVLARAIWGVPRSESVVVIAFGLTGLGIWAQFVAFAIHRFGGADQDSTVKKKEYHHGT